MASPPNASQVPLEQIRSDGTESQYNLRISPSSYEGAGLGLFAVTDIPAGQDVISRDPLVVVVNKSSFGKICDYCFGGRNSAISKNDYTKTASAPKPALRLCKGCRAVRYCDVCLISLGQAAKSIPTLTSIM